ncbi:single-stranded DNA-binding protein [Candidatus Saccharibacteria bacterium]|nr:single-stranded DNA-binding protein [Candidatus Saccharibacteria bacterium]
MRGFSKAIITGNLTRDPELRTTPNGASVCSFSVAVNRVYKDANGAQREDVSFIDCSAWGKLGEMINQYAKKGSGVLVSGRLDQRSWEDKNTGQKRSRTEIVVEDFNFTGSAPSSNGTSSFGASDTVTSADSAEGSSDPADAPAGGDIPADAEGQIDLSEVPF